MTKAIVTTITEINNPKLFFTILLLAEGEGFEPPKAFSLSGFQDRRDRPLCHPSGFLALFQLAGREGLEPPTDGFGDRYSTN